VFDLMLIFVLLSKMFFLMQKKQSLAHEMSVVQAEIL
jgi:hypothetical protein